MDGWILTVDSLPVRGPDLHDTSILCAGQGQTLRFAAQIYITNCVALAIV